ncbi:MAG: ThuA domain-containing protein [Roseburia sp.]|nr:ThuA domain-containing protein [Roseburia sp.]
MNKLAKIICAMCIAVSSVTLFTACGNNDAADNNATHTHRWSTWTRTDTEHSRQCRDGNCNEIQRAAHEGGICKACADFNIVAFGDLNGSDPAHNDFVKEANTWFPANLKSHGFYYEFNGNWNAMTDEYLNDYDLVMFLNNMPGSATAQTAFRKYMENGGAWLGCHVSAFSMNNDKSDWQKWYHNEFLGSGDFRTNTWNPTRNKLKTETHGHFATADLPDTFLSAYNEWYNWEYDLRKNDDITILLSIDPSGYPVGDKPGETWNYDYENPDAPNNFCPVAWTNNNYNMIYMNMGHNLQDYNTYEKHSETFASATQNKFILNAIFGLVGYDPII